MLLFWLLFNEELKCHLMQNIICFSGTCCYIIEELQLVSNGITWCIMLLMLLLHNWTSSWLLWPHANRCNELSLFNSQFCRSYSDLLGYFGHGCHIHKITYLFGSKISSGSEVQILAYFYILFVFYVLGLYEINFFTL